MYEESGYFLALGRPIEAADRSRLREAVAHGYRRIVLSMPTGGGKTLTAAHIIHGALAKGKRPLFMAPSINLVEQTVAALEREGVLDIGVMQARHERTDFEAAVQVASLQTFIRRADWKPDVVIIDECHERYEALDELMLSTAWAGRIVIGLSATPWAKGMGLVWEHLIVASTTEDLIDEGYLCPYRVFGPRPGAPVADLSGVRTVAGDYAERPLSEAMQEPKLVADIVQTWLDKGDNQPTFLFGVDRAHAQKLQAEFLRSGVSCSYIDGFSKPDERKEIFRRFRAGEDKIISSVGCLTTGIDEDCRVLIDAAPTKSEIRHIQKLGRALRPAPGKEHAIILDHAGNCVRLGMPIDVRHDELDCRKPGDGKSTIEMKLPPKPRECTACGAIMPAGVKICPECGREQVVWSDIETDTSQELEELGRSELLRERSKPVILPVKERVAALGGQTVFDMLELIRTGRGYKPGWTAATYREIFDKWPARSMCAKDRNPIIVNELYSWLRSRQIAFVKRKEKANG